MSVASLTLDDPPSCIAFCPEEVQYFVVGTYRLLEANALNDLGRNDVAEDDVQNDHNCRASTAVQKAQYRAGSLVLFRLNGDRIAKESTVYIEDGAVLDIGWEPHAKHRKERLLAVAMSTGSLRFYRFHTLSPKEDDCTQLASGHKFALHCSKQISDTSTLVLQVRWHPTRPSMIGAALSDGLVCLCESTASDEIWSEASLVKVWQIQQHDFQAWTVAFVPRTCPPDESSQHDSIDILSGGDDMVLQHSCVSDCQSPVSLWQDRKIHGAGITAIAPLTEDLVITGSYDNHIRLISAPAAGRRRVLADLDLGGGVWQLKFIGETNLILASCMHAGARIVALSGDTENGWSFDVIARFTEHSSMNYGSDVQPTSSTRKTVISTSFYDRLLCLWHFDVNRRELQTEYRATSA